MAYKPNDAYYKRAKQEGYRSRAAYKLIELQQRFHLIKAGDLVVDLGAAPGGWLQVAANYIGATGKVIGYAYAVPFRKRPAKVSPSRYSRTRTSTCACALQSLAAFRVGRSRRGSAFVATVRFRRVSRAL